MSLFPCPMFKLNFIKRLLLVLVVLIVSLITLAHAELTTEFSNENTDFTVYAPEGWEGNSFSTSGVQIASPGVPLATADRAGFDYASNPDAIWMQLSLDSPATGSTIDPATSAIEGVQTGFRPSSDASEPESLTINNWEAARIVDIDDDLARVYYHIRVSDSEFLRVIVNTGSASLDDNTDLIHEIIASSGTGDNGAGSDNAEASGDTGVESDASSSDNNTTLIAMIGALIAVVIGGSVFFTMSKREDKSSSG